MTGYFNPETAREASEKAHSSMTRAQRTERAKKAAAARWARQKGEGWVPPAEDVALAPFYDIVDDKYPGLPPVARTAAARALRTEYGRAE